MEIPPSKSPLVHAWMINRKARSSSSCAKNRDIFAWQPSDMTGVPIELAEHYLNINPGAKPVKQPLRRFGDKKQQAIGKEIAKLLKAGFIREVIHTLWVANPVLVPKKNIDILRMCIDYIGLNKDCPKD